MKVSKTKRYISSKKQFKNNKALLKKIDYAIELLKQDDIKSSLEFKQIFCKRDKSRYSIRIVGTQYRVLFSLIDNYTDLVCICDHDKYQLHNKNC